MVAYTQPLNHTQQETPVTNSFPSDPRIAVIAKAYDQAMQEHNRIQCEMERQLRETEGTVSDVLNRNLTLVRENIALGKRAASLVEQLDALGKQLAAAKQTTDTLRAQLIAAHADGHIYAAALETALKEKQVLQTSYSASEGRNAAQLEINVKLLKEVEAIRRLPQLKQAYRTKTAEVNRIGRLRKRQIVTQVIAKPIALSFAGGIIGFCVGGPFGAFAGVMAAQVRVISQVEGGIAQEVEDGKRWAEQDALQYEIVQIQTGLTREAFLSKPEGERSQILAQCEIG